MLCVHHCRINWMVRRTILILKMVEYRSLHTCNWEVALHHSSSLSGIASLVQMNHGAEIPNLWNWMKWIRSFSLVPSGRRSSLGKYDCTALTKIFIAWTASGYFIHRRWSWELGATAINRLLRGVKMSRKKLCILTQKLEQVMGLSH